MSINRLKQDAAALEKLFLDGRHRSLNKGQIIQSTESSKINLLTKGYVKRYLISNDGTLGIQIIYGPGNIFPITVMFRTLFAQETYEGPEVFYYEAMSDIEIHTLDGGEVANSVEGKPLLYRALLSETGRRLHSNLHGLESIALKTSYRRVAHQLVYLAKHFGKSKASGRVIEVPLTHQVLSEMLNLSRETVSMCFAKLRSKGLIKSNKSIIVKDMGKLEQEAYNYLLP